MHGGTGLMAGAAGFSGTLDCLYAACQDPALWPEALTAAADHVGALGGFLVRNAPPGQTGAIISGRLCEELNRSYIASYSDNLWTQAIRDARRSGPVIAGSLVREQDLVRTACYADIIGPHGAIDMAILGVDALCRDGSVGGFGFPLSRRQADDPGVARRLRRLAPHLQRALVLALQIGGVGGERDRTLPVILERMGAAGIVLDGAARVLFANTAAQRILAAGLILHVDADRRLAAMTTTGNLRLAAEVRAALAPTSPERGRPVFKLNGIGRSRPLTLLVSPLPRPAFALVHGLDAASVLVLVLGGGPVTAELAVRTAFGLSAAEARVAVMVAGGMDRPAVAQALGVSVETVKKHLQQCFTKTGTHGQAEMMRLVLHLPQDGS